MRLSLEMDSLRNMMRIQTNRALSSNLNDMVIPEIESMIGNLPLHQNGVRTDMSACNQGLVANRKCQK